MGRRRQGSHRVVSKLSAGGLRRHSDEGLTKEKAFDLDKILPQPLEDNAMAQEASRFFTAIDDHVENYYHDQPVQQIVPIGKEQGLPSGIFIQRDVDIQYLLADPDKRFSAVSSLICAKILDYIDLCGDPERSLLPPMVVKFLHDIPKQHTDSHGMDLISIITG
jgi:hypothetical protein